MSMTGIYGRQSCRELKLRAGGLPGLDHLGENGGGGAAVLYDPGGLAARLGLPLLHVGVSLRLGDASVLVERGGLPAAEGVEVADVVGDVLDLQDVEDEAEVREVVLRFR